MSSEAMSSDEELKTDNKSLKLNCTVPTANLR